MSSTNVFILTPEEETDMLKEVGDREIDLLEKALRSVHDDGYVIFAPNKGAQQLWGYMTETLPQELLMLLDPEYREKVDAGLYLPPTNPGWYLMDPNGKKVMRPHAIPGFQLAIFASQEEAVQWGQIVGMITPEMLMPQVDPMTMQPMAPQLPVEQRRSFWGGMMTQPVFKGGGPMAWEQRAFQRLWNTWGQKQEQAGVLM